MMRFQTAALPLKDELALLPWARGVEKDVLLGMTVAARIMRYDKGAFILTQGQALSHYYVLLDGWCGASKSNAEGQETILQIFHHGDFLPEPVITAYNKTNFLNIQALTNVRLLIFPTHCVQAALQQSSVFSANMLRAVQNRCEELRAHIEQLTLLNAEQRVGRFLLQIRLESGGDAMDFELPFNKAFIASYLDIKPETLSRVLLSFKEKGFVVTRNQLRNDDNKALCGYCDPAVMVHCASAHTEDCPNGHAVVQLGACS